MYNVFVLNYRNIGDPETYQVYVTTSDKKGAGTDANVFVIIYGDLGDTGMYITVIFSRKLIA